MKQNAQKLDRAWHTLGHKLIHSPPSPVEDSGCEDGEQSQDHLDLLNLLGRIPRQATHMHVLTLAGLSREDEEMS